MNYLNKININQIIIIMEHIFKVVDFNIYNEKKINTDEDEDYVEIIQVNEN